MWWQILPPLGIIAAMFGSVYISMPVSMSTLRSLAKLHVHQLTYVSLQVIHYVFKGRPTNRGNTDFTVIEHFQKAGFRRDVWMTGEEHRSRGLDYISDE